MNDFVTVVLRWSIRIFLLIMATVFFLSLLVAASLLALVWGVRALWAKLSGRPVTPWVMGVNPAAAWSSVYRSRTTVWSTSAGPAQAADMDTDAGNFRRRGGILPGNEEVVDVQPRELREP